MFLLLGALLIAAWCLYMSLKFYRRVDWGEPADPSPDLQGMHKRQAELQHIQEVLESAAAEGHLSSGLVNEFNRYCEAENERIRKIESAWKNRHKASN